MLRLTPHEIQWELPYTRGLQVEALWVELQGHTTAASHSDVQPLASRLWQKISGLF